MNKKDSWISEYRKAKFYEKHQKGDYIDNSNFHNNKKDIINNFYNWVLIYAITVITTVITRSSAT